jgi:autophagy-related protein 9
LGRFVSFIAGSLLGVLAIASLIDGDLIQGFEIAQGLNGLSSIAALTTIVAVSRGMLPEDNTVYDPEWSIRNVIQHTHYMPEAWRDKLRTDDVRPF